MATTYALRIVVTMMSSAAISIAMAAGRTRPGRHAATGASMWSLMSWLNEVSQGRNVTRRTVQPQARRRYPR